jgi:1,4-alpha-glucan branching enzyme
MSGLVKELNGLYRREPALYRLDDRPEGFEWIDFSDAENTVWSFLRKAPKPSGGNEEAPRRDLLVIVNATPVVRHGYRVGVPHPGWYEEILNSDATRFGGSGNFSSLGFMAGAPGSHGRTYSITLDLPPLATVILGVPLP